MKIGSYGFTADSTSRSKTGWRIYHNPRCSNSREALDLLRANGIDPEIVEYLHTPLKKNEIEELIAMLQNDVKELIRTKEKVFASLNLDLSDRAQIIGAIVSHPELMQRPIIVHKGKALIARPPERALELV